MTLNPQKQKIILILVPLLFLFIGSMMFFSSGKSAVTMDDIRTLQASEITAFYVYPRAVMPQEDVEPRLFSPSEQIVQDFLDAAADIQSYRFSRGDAVSLEDNRAFVKIVHGEGEIHINLSIPETMQNAVRGDIGRVRFGSMADSWTTYGSFISEGLYHWFIQYKEIWL